MTTCKDLNAARFERDALPHVDLLYRVARRYTRSNVDAEDLVQDTMMKAYKGFRGYQDGTNIRAWLLQILTNTWINSYQRAQRRPDELLSEDITDAQLAQYSRHSSAGLPSAELLALESMGDHEIRLAIEQLNSDQRLVVYYADVEGLRYKEIAEILGIPEGTVMSRLYRGRRTLRTLLARVAYDRGYLRRPQVA